MLSSSEVKFLYDLLSNFSKTIKILPFAWNQNKLILCQTKRQKFKFYLSLVLELFLFVGNIWRIKMAASRSQYAFLMIYGIGSIALLFGICCKILLSKYLNEFLCLFNRGIHLNQFLSNRRGFSIWSIGRRARSKARNSAGCLCGILTLDR